MSHRTALRGRGPLAALALVSGMLAAFAGPAANAGPKAEKHSGPTFERHVLPIFKAYCWSCHGGEACVAGLDLRTFPLLMQGGKSGPTIVRGSVEKSLLFAKFGGNLASHPPANSRPTPAHIATLRAWIEDGVPADDEGGPVSKADSPPLTVADRTHWAFKSPVRSKVPLVKSTHVRTPIDAFLLKRLEDRGLGFSPQADRATLIRRALFDVIGLPPTPAEVDAFIHDPALNAYDCLVERLLASPHYGERWGRHWLDAAGYVDTRGTDNDAGIIEPLDGIWKYRDYVIRSFNENRPYDRFVLDQLAGDEQVDWREARSYRPGDVERLIATGFLRQAADVTYVRELNTSDIRHQVLFDTVQTVSQPAGAHRPLAQCHTHKFDPISHADYYRIVGIFLPAYDPHNWLHSKKAACSRTSRRGRKRQWTPPMPRPTEKSPRSARRRRPCAGRPNRGLAPRSWRPFRRKNGRLIWRRFARPVCGGPTNKRRSSPK